MTEDLDRVDLEPERRDCEIAEIFPTPPGVEEVWLAEALLGVFDSVGDWLQASLGGQEGRAALVALLDRRRATVPQQQKGVSRRELKGDYDAAGIMVGQGQGRQPRGIQTLRGLVWLVLTKRRRSNQPSASVVHDLAAALRAAARARGKAAGPLSQALAALGQVGTFAESIDALSVLDDAKHQALRDLWVGWLRPELAALAADPDGASGRTAVPTSRPTKPSWPRRSRRPSLNGGLEGERTEDDDGPQVQALARSRPFEGRLPYEPPSEFGEQTYLVTIPGRGAGTAENVARFYALRAIWTGNTHLLSRHIDAVPPPVYGSVVDALVQELMAAPPGSETALGAAGCLLKALTGRPTRGVRAFRIDGAGHEGPIGPGCIDLDAGLIWTPVFWKESVDSAPIAGDSSAKSSTVSYFRPAEAQRRHLEPVTDRLALPLPRPVRNALRAHHETLRAMVATDPERLDSAMSMVLSDLADRLGVVVSVGGLRRALGPLVNEQCGDPAMAQLICGESFGLTTAPLHYYAPKLKHVAETYRATLAQHFGPSPMWRIPACARRIGSELMVTLETARRLASASYQAARGQNPGDGGDLEWVATLRSMVDHLARMIIGAAGHRPSEALFQLTRTDIDLESGAALFNDKQHDIAHSPRLACVPQVVVDQINAYLAYLRSLQGRVPAIDVLFRKILDGTHPLLIDLDDHGKVIPMTLSRLTARSPHEWGTLPWNWSRTWIRTSVVESGVPAFFVSAQLGHFDSIGYPYSNQSPTDPIEMVAGIRPHLDKLAARTGWCVIGARHIDKVTSRTPQEPLPLRDWRAEIDHCDGAASKAHRQWEHRIKAERRQLRIEALKAVTSHPDMIECGLAAAYADPTVEVSTEAFESLDVEAIRDELVLQCGDDAIAASAHVRALREVIKRLSERANRSSPTLPVPIPVRRPLDNPFFLGACMALTQVTALRKHVRDRGRLPRPDRAFDLQVSRTAEALALFGGIDDASTIIAILEARSHAVPSAKIDDLLLVPLNNGQCASLRGIAALSVAALAHDFPHENLPDTPLIDRGLSEIFPAWVIDRRRSSSGMLARLCSTVGVSNRFEYSPAARFALDQGVGSIQASLEEQIAFIDGDPVGPVRSSPNTAQSERGGASVRVEGPAGIGAHHQYRQLIAMIPTRGKKLALPLTGVTIPATSIETRATRDYVLDELKAWLGHNGKPRPISPIVRMLGEWSLAELARSRSDNSRLKDKTVATYLTRIGRSLVRMLGDLELSQWDEQCLEDAYAFALDASKMAKHKVAAALLSFHHFAEGRFDLPDADIGAVYAALGLRRRNVDAAMILPVERERALERLSDVAWRSGGDDNEIRRARLAEFVALWLGRGGARLSESLGLRVRDLGRSPSGELYAVVRGNRMRSLKTRSARRTIFLGSVHGSEQDRVWMWREAVRHHAPPGRPGSAYLTAELDDARSFREQVAVCASIRQALAATTGRPSERLHRLRHLAAQESITAIALSSDDARSVGLDSWNADRPLLPRDLAAISVELGHSHWMTTLQSYIHVPLVLQSRAAARVSRRYFNRQTLAGALGYTPAFLDSLLRDRPGISKSSAWFGRFRRARSQPVHAAELRSSAIPPEIWTAERVAKFLDESSRCADMQDALRLCGMPLEAKMSVVLAASRWERRMGRRLLPLNADECQVQVPRKGLRRTSDDTRAERLWVRFDHGDAMMRLSLQQIADLALAELSPGDGEKILLPEERAKEFAEILRSEGIDAASIDLQTRCHGMSQLSIVSEKVRDKKGRPRRVGIRRVLAVIWIATKLQESSADIGSSSSP